MRKLIAITGGIGCGKSVVAEILRALGRKVYDCDSRAKMLMDADDAMRRRIRDEISEATVDGTTGKIDRRKLASIVFSDSSKLEILNGIVHGSVRYDIIRWAASLPDETIFVETAILYQSGLDLIVDEVWNVTAPDDIRMVRVRHRDGLKAEDVTARMKSQSGYEPPRHHSRVFVIVNDGVEAILPQVLALLG